MEKDEAGAPKVYTEGSNHYYKLIYAEFGKDPRTFGFTKSFTGTFEPPDFKILINNWFKQKEHLLMCYGWSKGAIPRASVETSVVRGYPHCHWYNFFCNKRTPRRKSLDDAVKDIRYPFLKDMTNYYKGAVNTVSIVVPYIGDYKVKAYDKHNNLIGETTVYEDQFIDSTSDKASYAQLMFGLKMDLAENIQEGTDAQACRYDLMTEWGGGVSGIYYENQETGMGYKCAKSNDLYVQDHSAVKLTVQSLGSDKAFVIKLDKPLPFANRAFLVTLGQKEVRKYRCFEDFKDCKDSDFITDEGEQK